MTERDRLRLFISASDTAEAMVDQERERVQRRSPPAGRPYGVDVLSPRDRATRMKELDAYVASIDDRAPNALDDLLPAWLALYFNRTPRADLWQDLAERVDREGGPPTYAFIMKMYGDIYRSERRRWNERQRLGFDVPRRSSASGGLCGIATVVDHSVLTHPGDEQRLADKRCLGLSGVAETETIRGKWLDRQRLEEFAEHDDIPPAVFTAVTERLARLYCALQIFSYVSAPRRLVLIWTGTEGDARSVREAASRNLRYDGQEAFFDPSGRDSTPSSAPAARGADEPLPICVLDSRGGMMRDWWHAASSPYSKRTSTALHRDLWHRINTRLDVMRKESNSRLWVAGDMATL
jgi:hypothetical protein